MADLAKMFGKKPAAAEVASKSLGEAAKAEPLSDNLVKAQDESSDPSHPAIVNEKDMNHDEAKAQDAAAVESQPEAGNGGQSVPAESPPAAAKRNPFARPASTAERVESEAAKSDESVSDAGQALAPAAQPNLTRFKLPGSASTTSRSGGDSGLNDSSGATGAVQPVQETAGLTLDSLSQLDVSEVVEERPKSQFADETPATKPTRELPEGLEKQQLQFVDLLDGMYEIVGDPELLGNVVKSMMIELKANPQYVKLLSPSDVRMVVRAARDSMGIARVKKTETKTKRGSGAAASKSKVVDTDMLGDLESLGIEL